MSSSRWYLLPLMMLIGLPAPTLVPDWLPIVAGPLPQAVAPPTPGPQLAGPGTGVAGPPEGGAQLCMLGSQVEVEPPRPAGKAAQAAFVIEDWTGRHRTTMNNRKQRCSWLM